MASHMQIYMKHGLPTVGISEKFHAAMFLYTRELVFFPYENIGLELSIPSIALSVVACLVVSARVYSRV